MKTPALPDIFLSERSYRDRFVKGLSGLLEQDDINLFILVCANATSDEKLFAAIGDRLADRYQKLQSVVVGSLQGGGVLNVADDDLLVFLKIVALGWQEIKPAQLRNESGWELQYNQLRSFRPMRNAASRVESLQFPFDEAGFNFNKHFMQQEVIWSGRLYGVPVDLYYNKFPFAELHALLVPERTRNRPQFLTTDMHHYIWSVTAAIGVNIPTIRIAYNASGAFASVNHLHFQLCVRSAQLPIESTDWKHNGGPESYPVGCHVFADPDAAWDFIASLHAQNQAYNLLYSPGKLYCLPRLRQGQAPQPQWSPGLSWYELSGGFITYDFVAYNSLTAGQLAETLRAIAL